MWKTIALYAAALAAGTFALAWIDYQHLTRAFSTEIYIALVAVGFTTLGAWVGVQLTRRTAPTGFECNAAALRALGLTSREYAVLELVAAGRSNKEIARSLGVSPNTVKTHLSHLFEKLRVGRRTHAVHAARQLSLIP